MGIKWVGHSNGGNKRERQGRWDRDTLEKETTARVGRWMDGGQIGRLRIPGKDG